jgi:hypothetical protein
MEQILPLNTFHKRHKKSVILFRKNSFLFIFAKVCRWQDIGQIFSRLSSIGLFERETEQGACMPINRQAEQLPVCD